MFIIMITNEFSDPLVKETYQGLLLVVRALLFFVGRVGNPAIFSGARVGGVALAD